MYVYSVPGYVGTILSIMTTRQPPQIVLWKISFFGVIILKLVSIAPIFEYIFNL